MSQGQTTEGLNKFFKSDNSYSLCENVLCTTPNEIDAYIKEQNTTILS
jgi:hypothetical protein